MQGPTVVVMDNASIHTSEAFQEEIPTWEKKGLSIFSPPYTFFLLNVDMELNRNWQCLI
jgi:hypothetical protein